jgi:hypothetical protein
MLKIFKLIDKKFKLDIIKFYFLLFVVTIFEFLAVFIILPISQVFFKKEIEVSFFFTDYLNSINYETLVIISVISLVIIYLFKNIFIIYFWWW